MLIVPRNLHTKMNSIQLKINELLMFYSGCHGNLVMMSSLLLKLGHYLMHSSGV